ncbi:MAG: MBOAT family protein, partial [Bacteroidales bacterium]|nr:MBOAT family protein [Bacteroidales bacterium]
STFILVLFGWILFRAATIGEAFTYIKGIFSKSLFTIPDLTYFLNVHIKPTLMFIVLLVVVEWFSRKGEYGFRVDKIRYSFVRWLIYFLILFIIFVFGGTQQQFIYFQF